ncbi:MAG: hypothetical protein EBU90_12740 [Proteobacteria bacterium]|nr:hypothetical protein [Pseudomonadota bacterium]NBP14864.1 hypothetical protein [bacterium]
MAKKAIDCQYTFNPATRTVTITSRWVKPEKLLLITNVTRGIVIYNFSDPDLRATSYTGNTANSATNISGVLGYLVSQGSQNTVIVLNYNTAAMASTDKLMIIIDEQEEYMAPADAYCDPVQKLRVSTPQSLIDTDFEYSVQPSKWEFMVYNNNWPSFFSKGTGGNSFIITAISGNNSAPRSSITVTTSVAHGLSVGNVVAVQETTNQLADGVFIVTSIPAGTQFTYLAKGQINGSILDSGYTLAYGGDVFEYAAVVPTAISGNGAAQSVMTVTLSQPTGWLPGTPIILTQFTSSALDGTHVVSSVTSPTSFTFVLPTSFNGAGTIGSGKIYVAPEGYVQHRSTDGGVSITPGGSYTGVQAIRQTRVYFRYQSGKGIQFSTGWKPTPSYDIDQVSASGVTATVTCQQDHGLQPGTVVFIEGLTVVSGTNFYNGSFTVASVTGTKSFTYTMAGTPLDTAPTGDNAQLGAWVTPQRWTGATCRSGLFDDQNGFFFEYDGNQLYACRRQSIKEMFGKAVVTNNSQVVTQASGTTTRFRSQLVVGDNVVIRGMNYRVIQIDSDTQMRIAPAYRGPTVASGVRYLRTQTFKVPQSQWNQDRCDGTGPSGYNINPIRMQMVYIDYTWYGAGYIRFGFRGVNGEIIYCHRMPNNNVYLSAYQRSGNLPGRFEVTTDTYFSKLKCGAGGVKGQNFGAADTIMYVDNAQFWPSTGFVFVNDGTNCEMIQYSAIGAYNDIAAGYPLTGLTRRTSFSIAGIGPTGTFSNSAYTLGGTSSSVTFSPSAAEGGSGTSQVSVRLAQTNCAILNSHWGVSVMMDGRYDEDTQYIFTAGMRRYLTVSAGATRPILALRLAPSVDSGNGRNFGTRELINRMSLTLEEVTALTNGQFLIQGILNPASLSGGGLTVPTSWDLNPNVVGSGSLSQVFYFDSGNVYAGATNATGSISGGDQTFAFYTENSGGVNYSRTAYKISNIRELSNSIQSGNGTSVTVGFPAGPDVLVITATNIGTSGTANIQVRLGWTEAQA